MDLEQYANIRGEYWIEDGYVNFADGDIGDRNHESIAIEHVFNKYAEEIVDLADELSIPTKDDYERYDGPNTEALSALLNAIFDRLTNDKEDMSHEQAGAYLMQHIGANNDAMQILYGGGNGSLYVMKYEGWIAVRENNVELYGYDQNKQKIIVNGIGDILEQEGISEEIPPENVELSFYDHKTHRSWNETLADLEQSPNIAPRTTNTATNAYKKTFYGTSPKDSEENKYSNSSKSKQNKWTAAAQKKGVIGPGQELWRGTSESKCPNFSEWLKKKTF